MSSGFGSKSNALSPQNLSSDSSEGAGSGRLEFWLVFAGAVFAEILLPIVDKYQSGDGSGSLLAQIIWSLMYASAGIRLFALKGITKPLLVGSTALWLFAIFMLTSFLWSVSPKTTFVNGIELIGTTVVGTYLVARFTLSQLLHLVALTFGTIAVLSLLFVFVAPGHGRMNYGSGPWAGIYQDKNNLGRAMSLAIMSLVALLSDSTRRKFLFTTLVLVLVGCTSLLLGSASATALGDCVVVVAANLALIACKSKRFGIPARVVTAISGFVALIAYGVFGLTVDSIFGVLGRDTSLTGRSDFWPYLQQAIAARPILGYGYNAFFGSSVGDSYLSYYVVEAGGFSPYHAHNSFLQISLDGGYVGVGLLGIVLLISIWRGFSYLLVEHRAYAGWPLMIVVYLILGSFTETYFGNYNSIEWILFVAAILYPVRLRLDLQAVKPAEKRSGRVPQVALPTRIATGRRVRLNLAPSSLEAFAPSDLEIRNH